MLAKLHLIVMELVLRSKGFEFQSVEKDDQLAYKNKPYLVVKLREKATRLIYKEIWMCTLYMIELRFSSLDYELKYIRSFGSFLRCSVYFKKS